MFPPHIFPPDNCIFIKFEFIVYIIYFHLSCFSAQNSFLINIDNLIHQYRFCNSFLPYAIRLFNNVNKL